MRQEEKEKKWLKITVNIPTAKVTFPVISVCYRYIFIIRLLPD